MIVPYIELFMLILDVFRLTMGRGTKSRGIHLLL